MIAKIITTFYDENGKILKQLERFPPFGQPVATAQINPIERAQWPQWAKIIATRATPEDKGIGDVAARMIGDEKSAAFKIWFKATFGKDCGCTGRQNLWNIQYPLNLKAT